MSGVLTLFLVLWHVVVALFFRQCIAGGSCTPLGLVVVLSGALFMHALDVKEATRWQCTLFYWVAFVVLVCSAFMFISPWLGL